jgi:hypothetical protein
MIIDTPGAPVAWWEFIKSLLFWGIFLAVIFFALRYYLSQNTVLWNAIRAFPVFRWLGSAWSSLRAWLRGANRQIRGLVRSGIQRMRQQQVALPTRALRRVFNLARLSPRDKIIFFYTEMVRMGGEHGIERRPSQTPYVYEQRLDQALPDVHQDLHGLTETFLEARYSPHSIEQPEAEKAASLWDHIKAVLRSWKKPDA